jgi:hypothetical protein
MKNLFSSLQTKNKAALSFFLVVFMAACGAAVAVAVSRICPLIAMETVSKIP